jgi:hypothetical protein
MQWPSEARRQFPPAASPPPPPPPHHTRPLLNPRSPFPTPPGQRRARHERALLRCGTPLAPLGWGACLCALARTPWLPGSFRRSCRPGLLHRQVSVWHVLVALRRGVQQRAGAGCGRDGGGGQGGWVGGWGGQGVGRVGTWGQGAAACVLDGAAHPAVLLGLSHMLGADSPVAGMAAGHPRPPLPDCPASTPPPPRCHQSRPTRPAGRREGRGRAGVG